MEENESINYIKKKRIRSNENNSNCSDFINKNNYHYLLNKTGDQSKILFSQNYTSRHVTDTRKHKYNKKYLSAGQDYINHSYKNGLNEKLTIKSNQDNNQIIIRKNENFTNNEFFKKEYLKALQALKSVDPDIYFKTRLDKLQESINKTKIYSKEELKLNYNFNHGHIYKSYAHAKLSNNLQSLLEIIKSDTNLQILFLSLCLLGIFSLKYLKALSSWITTDEIGRISAVSSTFYSFITLLILIVIIFIVKKFNFLHREQERGHEKGVNKKIAEEILLEMEEYLQLSKESKIDLQSFISGYCHDNKIEINEFNTNLYTEMNILISSPESKIIQEELFVDGKLIRYLKLK